MVLEFFKSISVFCMVIVFGMWFFLGGGECSVSVSFDIFSAVFGVKER